MTIAADLKARLAFVELDRVPPRLFCDAWALIDGALPSILDEFYTAVPGVPALRPLLEGQDLNRLKAAQRTHWQSKINSNEPVTSSASSNFSTAKS